MKTIVLLACFVAVAFAAAPWMDDNFVLKFKPQERQDLDQTVHDMWEDFKNVHGKNSVQNDVFEMLVKSVYWKIKEKFMNRNHFVTLTALFSSKRLKMKPSSALKRKVMIPSVLGFEGT